MSKKMLVIMAAPNVSEQFGGEAIKALHIFRETKKLYPDTMLITHRRNESEASDRLKLTDVHYIDDSWLDRLIWKSVVFRWFINWVFSVRAVSLAKKLANNASTENKQVVVWQTEPNSPVTPRAIARDHFNCFGPINGNIYYPSAFHKEEKLKVKLRRRLHAPLQQFNRLFFNKLTKADLIFVAGGERTSKSLKLLGCKPDIFYDTVDCGIQGSMFDFERIKHDGENYRFVHFGRLVYHKGTFLIIKAIAKSNLPICLDIIGRGPELDNLKALVKTMKLEERVIFHDWFTSHDELFLSLNKYRGFVIPSMEDANGIVVQEALAIGLPTIALNWGGPQLLIEHGKSGYLVEPKTEECIVSDLARYMEELATNGQLAEKMSCYARERASEWNWNSVINDWTEQIKKSLP